MMTEEHSSMLMNSISHYVDQAMYEIKCTAVDYASYSQKLKPKLYIDGNQWCALYGENIQAGVCGFGDSPAKALMDFDKSMCSDLPTPPKEAE